MIPQSYPLYARVWVNDDAPDTDGWDALVIGWEPTGTTGEYEPVFTDYNNELNCGEPNTATLGKAFHYRLVVTPPNT